VRTFQKLIKPFVYVLTWNAKYKKAFSNPKVIYDYVDEIAAFEGSPARLRKSHLNLTRNSDIVLTSANVLYQQIVEYRADTLLCANAVDYAHFARVLDESEKSVPQDMQMIINKGNPVIGYHGALVHWFNYKLLFDVARWRPELSIVLIGPEISYKLPSELINLPNVFWLGQKPYQSLPDYVRLFDVGIIPFKLNNITHATSPIKLYEYFAAGKPVVITSMKESLGIEGIFIADDLTNFSNKLDEAMEAKHDQKYLKMLDRIARENTWDKRAQQIMDRIYSLQPKRA
jgi:glycosyltransferase involved in cell wall biosynthesis